MITLRKDGLVKYIDSTSSLLESLYKDGWNSDQSSQVENEVDYQEKPAVRRGRPSKQKVE